MKRQMLNQSRLLAKASLLLSCQEKLSHVHSKTQFIQRFQNCKFSISAASKHSNIVKSGFLNDTITTNHLINSYIRLQKIDNAQRLFDEMSEPNVVSWTSLMTGYVNMGQPEIALLIFLEMHGRAVAPNGFTFTTVINACSILARIMLGRSIHAQVEVLGFRSNLVVYSSLIDMYGKCNEVFEARLIFDSMCSRNIVSWTSIITACAQNAQGHVALQIFREFNCLMLESPNHFMLASVINACASLGRIVSGKVTHGVVIRHGHDSNDVIASALVDMYAKCGSFIYSDKVFRRISHPCVIPYTSMIVGAAKYGLGTLSLELFDEMIDRRIKPNDVSFVGILHACSHSGLIDKGLEYLNSMHRKHGVIPQAKHYICVVDMLARVGRLEEAYQLAKSVQVEPDGGALMWGTLLSASRLQGRLDIAVEASRRLIESNQQVAGAYVTLSNTYALAGEWISAHSLRSEMKRTGIHKELGCSWIEN